VYERVAHLETAHDVWLKLCNTYEGSSEIASQNRRSEVSTGHALRSSGLLGVKESLVMVSQSGLKTGGGATTGGARDTITEVASEAS
jgi:hypothetical protein